MARSLLQHYRRFSLEDLRREFLCVFLRWTEQHGVVPTADLVTRLDVINRVIRERAD